MGLLKRSKKNLKHATHHETRPSAGRTHPHRIGIVSIIGTISGPLSREDMGHIFVTTAPGIGLQEEGETPPHTKNQTQTNLNSIRRIISSR